VAVYIDTSALAKWYLNEARSDDFEAYLRGVDRPTVSSLTVVETRSLLSRHRRMGHLSDGQEQKIFAQFQQDLAGGIISSLPVRDRDVLAAAHLLSCLPDHPLRTLDAIHLTLCQAGGLSELATADKTMAAAAADLGLEVARFD
jgi:predicted nucleic acid-binding protein